MKLVARKEVVNAVDTPSRWSHWKLLALLVTLLLAMTQVLIWVKAIEARGGPEIYVRGIDLMPTLAAGLTIREGKGPLLYDFSAQLDAQREVRALYPTLAGGRLLPFIHLPFEALLAAPFVYLPYAPLYRVFSLLALVSVAGSLWLMAGELPLVGAGRWILIAAVYSYQPLHQALWLGQTSTFLLLGLSGTYVALKRRQEYWAAASLLLVVLKPQVFLVVALLILCLGHWRALVVVVGALAGATVAAMPILGAAWPLQYAKFLADIAGWNQPSSIYPASMPTIRGLAINLLGGFAPILIVPFMALVSSILVGLLLWCCWRVSVVSRTPLSTARTRKLQLDLLWALTSLVAVLVPLHLGPHDLTLLLFPAWILASYLASGIWAKPLSTTWLALLWSAYAVALLIPFDMETPGLVVVPSVLLLLAAVVTLFWQIGQVGAAPRTGNTALSLSSA